MRVGVGISVAAVAASVCLTACGSSSPSSTAPTSSPRSTSVTTSSGPATGQSAIDRWSKAYAYLSNQTKPTEIVCLWFAASGATPSPVPRPALFYNFSNTGRWKSHLVTRKDPLPKGTFEDCEATVPTTVTYGPAIEPFLRRFGLTFAGDPNTPASLTPIEIAYAGQNSDDPDIIYRDKPGLFGLRMALAQIGTTPFEPGTSKIVQPTNDATAAQYLQYATPLLNWYRYKS
jgi:hypothetical protein